MKVYKRLSRWWEDNHGGEFKVHADFTIQEGETFAGALANLFENDPGYERYWQRPTPESWERKIHLQMSVNSQFSGEG